MTHVPNMRSATYKDVCIVSTQHAYARRAAMVADWVLPSSTMSIIRDNPHLGTCWTSPLETKRIAVTYNDHTYACESQGEFGQGGYGTEKKMVGGWCQHLRMCHRRRGPWHKTASRLGRGPCPLGPRSPEEKSHHRHSPAREWPQASLP